MRGARRVYWIPGLQRRRVGPGRVHVRGCEHGSGRYDRVVQLRRIVVLGIVGRDGRSGIRRFIGFQLFWFFGLVWFFRLLELHLRFERYRLGFGIILR